MLRGGSHSQIFVADRGHGQRTNRTRQSFTSQIDRHLTSTRLLSVHRLSTMPHSLHTQKQESRDHDHIKGNTRGHSTTDATRDYHSNLTCYQKFLQCQKLRRTSHYQTRHWKIQTLVTFSHCTNEKIHDHQSKGASGPEQSLQIHRLRYHLHRLFSIRVFLSLKSHTKSFIAARDRKTQTKNSHSARVFFHTIILLLLRSLLILRFNVIVKKLPHS